MGLAVKPPCAFALRRAVADRAEVTFELLRYRLGGNRPSQTDPLALSRPRIHGAGLDDRLRKTGISLVPPPLPEGGPPRLPAMLRMRSQSPVPEYSEGSWGLSVLLRVPSICTGTTTSPSSSLRQRRDRYTIRAGRNLPDKEFRWPTFTGALVRSFALRLTPRLDLSALVTCHTLYVPLRVGRVLCFC